MSSEENSDVDGAWPRAASAPSPGSAASLSDRLAMGMLDAAVGLVLLGDDGTVRFANRRVEAMLGRGRLGDRAAAERFAWNGDAPNPDTREDTLLSTFETQGGGRAQIVWTRNAAGGWIGVVPVAVRAATPQVETLETDPPTSLPLRAHLQGAVEAWRRGAPDATAAALYLDLDFYRRATEILDQPGCASLIRKVAQRLRQIIRAEDVLARLGDDEFAIFVVGDAERGGPTELADRVVELLSRPFLVGGEQIIIGATVGVAARPVAETSAEELLRLANIALQHARKSGHGRVEWYEAAMGDAVRERHFIEMALRRAVLLDEFQVYFQPQFFFSEGTIGGFEALIRWHHPERGMIPPSTFIPVAEEIGLMQAIGASVLRGACRAAAAWSRPLSVAVNVSPLQFEQDDFVEIVADALATSGLAPERLELELTEALLLTNSEKTVSKMNALRAFGVRLALDDFGIGYSSLNYLRQFPFDKIKIDQSFVRGPQADLAAFRIVAAVAELGEAFGMSVLAEGVETESQLETMRERGCAGVQGYFFSRPMPAPDVDRFISDFSAPAAPASGS